MEQASGSGGKGYHAAMSKAARGKKVSKGVTAHHAGRGKKAKAAWVKNISKGMLAGRQRSTNAERVAKSRPRRKQQQPRGSS
mmetsp:Transcript_12515/g.22125  ORF Transcript_12515/g.22125 Transcript_12515/m.22125 type:complete len:82 (+) Transcript_12515:156-401(+)